MRPLWDIQGWSRHGAISDALRQAFRVSPEEPLSKGGEVLLHALRQTGTRRQP